MIPEPGVYLDTPAEVYRSWRAASKSTLKHWTKSMAHVRHATEHPLEPTKAMIDGTHLHAAVLEPEAFARRALVGPDEIRSAKGWKEWASAQPDGSWLFRPDEHARILNAARAVRLNPHAARLLDAPGHTEVSIVWDDPRSGVRCKCRVDRLTAAGGVELKSTADASPRKFQWTACDLGYYLGAELYQRAMRAWFPRFREMARFYCVAVEIDPDCGHCRVEVYHILSQWAEEEADLALAKYAACMKSGVWPGPVHRIIDLPEPVKRFAGESSEPRGWGDEP